MADLGRVRVLVARAVLLLAAPPSSGVQFNPALTRQPLRGPRGPRTPSLDPERDPMGRLNNVGYGYDDMVNNLVSHYQGANEDERKQGRLWYKAAHDLFHKLAADRGISPQRSVAMGAAFSPNTDWGQNIRHASDFMMNYHPESPDHNENDWRMAHLHPQALDAFRQQAGRDPTDSQEDLNQLADLHRGVFKQGPSLSAMNDLDRPEARAAWMENIQHHGMEKVLADHSKQVRDNTGMVLGRPKTYLPQDAMRDSGIATLGGNIAKAKRLARAPEDSEAFYDVLGGPKISHFSNNILDDTPINEEGYYQHPGGDWTQNPDLGGTIDSHHLRAASMPHGGWVRKFYRGGANGLNSSDPYTYDVFNRGLLDATRKINGGIEDPTQHLTPKQVQATVWLKHKNDNAFFGKGGLNAQSEVEVGQPRVAKMTPEDFGAMPPLWRKMFMSRKPQEWTDLLQAWVDYSTGNPGQPSPGRQAYRIVNDARVLLAQIQLLAVPKDPSAQWGADVMRGLTRQPGPPGARQRQYPGVTVHENVGDAPTSGYMVSLPDHEQPQSMSTLTPGHINDYVRQNADVINSHPDNYYGGWGDEEGATPTYYHDVSRNVQDPWEAAGNALQWNQKAVYDVAQGEAPRTPEFFHDQIAKGGARRHTP